MPACARADIYHEARRHRQVHWAPRAHGDGSKPKHFPSQPHSKAQHLVREKEPEQQAERAPAHGHALALGEIFEKTRVALRGLSGARHVHSDPSPRRHLRLPQSPVPGVQARGRPNGQVCLAGAGRQIEGRCERVGQGQAVSAEVCLHTKDAHRWTHARTG